ncbi:hypothetical protein HZ989_05685 [Brevundimonas sp. AJA228-03]|uniref:hypothetical protein n=1 Tax=Brevundimonas sp. AJA228-03 TaxID=2752515 RepID=UPI001AE09272|nr:hypothetical protein [Brevundimonas sp. AJA228-03]QTN20548.1 hypothetical protein HZ989_05685 [Brevundimonas sp. AJA228-03]
MNNFRGLLGLSAALALMQGCASPPSADVGYDGVESRPVMMGGEPGLDACAGLSRIKPGRFVLIRDAPDESAQIVASLPAGTALWVCEEEGVPEGWTGVAFDTPGGPRTCEGPGTPSADRVPVPAVCQAGWAQFGDDVENLAG